MQGWKHNIPTEVKINYLNALLKVGFDTIDFGSFVSPKAIPQMADTAEVIAAIEPSSHTKLLAIIANLRGATEALLHDKIDLLGYPFSISPTFQKRNTNSSPDQAFETVEEIQNLCIKNKRELVVYLSMGFGNPYGDEYHEDLVLEWAAKMEGIGIKTISLADTVGLADPELIRRVCQAVISGIRGVEVGVHLHSSLRQWKEKLDAALSAGIKRFDGALLGIGGCPMAEDELVGNMDSSLMIPYFEDKDLLPVIDHDALNRSKEMASSIFK